MQTVHAAKSQLEIGLEQYDRAELKEMYNFLISLEISFYKNFIKPYHERIKELDNANAQVCSLPPENTPE